MHVTISSDHCCKTMSSEFQISKSKQVSDALMLVDRIFKSSCPCISQFTKLHLLAVIGVDANPLYATLIRAGSCCWRCCGCQVLRHGELTNCASISILKIWTNIFIFSGFCYCIRHLLCLTIGVDMLWLTNSLDSVSLIQCHKCFLPGLALSSTYFSFNPKYI